MTLPLHGLIRVVVASGAAVGLVYASTIMDTGLDLGPAASAAHGATAAQAARDVVLSCPGPELRGVAGVADVAVTGVVSAATAPVGALGGLVLPSGAGSLTIGPPPAVGTPPSTPSTPAPARGLAIRQPLPDTSTAVEAEATGPLAAGLAASQEWSANATDLRGLVSTSCRSATADAWLLGGGGSPGRQERLILVNPGANEVLVGLSLHGRSGEIPSPTGTGITVPARGRAVVLLDALAGTEPTPAVHVQASGGTVAGFLDDVWLDGSVPAGADTVGSNAPPSRTQVIPVAALTGAGVVRVVVPGSHEAVVSARLIGPTGGAPLPGNGVTRIPGGAVGELSLTGAPAGTYAVEVNADVPVVASVQVQRRAGTSPGDFAWSTSTTPVVGTAGAVFPAVEAGGPTRTLTLIATDAPVTADVVTVVGGTPRTRRVVVAADSSTTLPLAGADSVWVRRVDGAGELRAGVGSSIGTGADQLVSTQAVVDSTLTSTVSIAFPIP